MAYCASTNRTCMQMLNNYTKGTGLLAYVFVETGITDSEDISDCSVCLGTVKLNDIVTLSE